DLYRLPRRAEARRHRADDGGLHACNRVPHGVEAAGVLRQEARHARAARHGAAVRRLRRAVLRAAGQLSVGGADRGHAVLSRQPPVRLAVLPRVRAQGCGSRRARDARADRAGGRPSRSSSARTGPRRRAAGAAQLTDLAMPLATSILRAGAARPAPAADTLLLNFHQRSRKQGFVFTGKGTCIEFAFEEPPMLATDDALLLDDGRVVEIVADAEPV